MSRIPAAERKPKFVSREQLYHWLAQMAGEVRLIAPKDINGYVLYRSIEQVDEIVLDYSKPVLSIKDSFLPPTEKLFLIEKSAGELKISPGPQCGKQVLFGVRPCDAHGLQALDAVFINSAPPDQYYTQRRGNSIIIGMACRELAPTCFCLEVGSAPDDSQYMDLMLTEINSGYSLEVITERGRQLLLHYDLVLEDFSPGKPAQSMRYLQKYQNPSGEIWRQHYSDPLWDEVADRCLSCRACAYVCPTCRCFDVRDEAQAGSDHAQMFARIRCWDSCTGSAYRRIASGHNSRPEKAHRLRNRFYCKFYYFSQQYGPHACTGCGRCIDICPVGVDITEVLQYIAGTIIAEPKHPAEVGVS